VNRYSAIYEGTVRHRRFLPVQNEFQYRLFFLFLDLGELPTLFRGCRFWSFDGVNLAYFRRRDHLGDPHLPLDKAVRDLVTRETGCRPVGPIRLLTHLRYFGHCFNPASFYYCYDEADQRVQTIIVEVHNTPWLEEHCYILTDSHNEHPHPAWRRYQLRKAFHVSPFMPMDIRYDLRIREPGKKLSVHFRSLHQGQHVFDATLDLRHRELNPEALNRLMWSYPPMTLKVVAKIHWQALRLWRKRTPFYPHPKSKETSAHSGESKA
jgi:hypothetical protein